MEIYKEITSAKEKEFASLLNNQSKTKIEEGKIYEATVTKFSQKYCWVHLDQLKSEPAIDINEISHQLAALIAAIKEYEDRWRERSELSESPE